MVPAVIPDLGWNSHLIPMPGIRWGSLLSFVLSEVLANRWGTWKRPRARRPDSLPLARISPLAFPLLRPLVHRLKHVLVHSHCKHGSPMLQYQ